MTEDRLEELLTWIRELVEGERQANREREEHGHLQYLEIYRQLEEQKSYSAALRGEKLILQSDLEEARRLLAECESSNPPAPAPVPNSEPARREVGRVTMHPGEATYVTFGHHFLPGEVQDRVCRFEVGYQLATVIPINRHPDGSIRHATITTRAQNGKLSIVVVEEGDKREFCPPPSVDLRVKGSSVDLQLIHEFLGSDLVGVTYSFRVGALCGTVTVRYYVDRSYTWCLAIDNALCALDRAPADIATSWMLFINSVVVDWRSDTVIPYRERRLYHSSAGTLGFVVPDLARWEQVGAIPTYLSLPAPVSGKRITDLVSLSESRPHGVIEDRWGTPGGRLDIGLIPGWDVLMLLTGDPRLYPVSLKAADALGFYPVHLREPDTGDPYSIARHPRATLTNPNDRVPEADRIPVIPRPDSPYVPDNEHQPALGYLPWLMTGFRQYHDGLTFLSHYDLYAPNWKYRGEGAGLIGPAHQTTRAEGWVIRTLAVTAASTPSDESGTRTREFLSRCLERSLIWYLGVEKPASPLGIIGRNYDSLKYYQAVGVMDLASATRPWWENMMVVALWWVEKLGIVDPVMVREVGTWVAELALEGCRRFGVRGDHTWASDMPGELKITDWSTGKVVGAVRIRDWNDIITRLRPRSAFSGRDPQHYPSIGRALLAAATDWGMPGADEFYRELHQATVGEYPERYAATPQWNARPRTEHRED